MSKSSMKREMPSVASVRMHVRMGRVQMEGLRAIAAREGTGVSSVVKEAVRYFLRTVEQPKARQ